MKSKLLPMGVIISSLVTVSAMAADGQVNFSGQIIDVACNVINSTSNPLVVTLGQVSKNAFSGVGSTAAPTKFTIQLSDCPMTITKAAVKFDGTSVTGYSGVLALTQESGVASGVGIQLYDDINTAIPLYSASKQYVLTPGAGRVNNLDFIARYIATSANIGAGLANSMTSFTIVYN
ncbi:MULTISPECIES: fimbrial protein [Citrobacter]|uniref:fimbrial protein n=1 Tax=Citrobacter TaxID=544 RepID=UPI0019066F4B|nr:fimbrial protein [Citrobacter braakii]MBJ9239311.1 fimbrial protein [Citrobacter braakii]WAD30896.1 fimbrial protein [Citrobacter braakii]